MDTRYMESFVSVVECGSLAESARRLDLTSAAVAARVHILEQEFGTQLLKRSGRALKPTAAGVKVFEGGRAWLRDLRDLQATAQSGLPLGELRLGVFYSALNNILPPTLKRLYARHPALSVFVAPGLSADLYRQVQAGELDAAIVVEPQFAISKNCEWQALLEEPLVVVAPQELGDRDPLELLRSQPFIRYDRKAVGGQLADRYLRDHGIRPRQRLEIDALMAVASLVDQGLGVSLLPDWSMLWTSGMSLARVPLPDRAPVRRSGVVWLTHGPRAVLAQSLVAEACALFAPAQVARYHAGLPEALREA